MNACLGLLTRLTMRVVLHILQGTTCNFRYISTTEYSSPLEFSRFLKVGHRNRLSKLDRSGLLVSAVNPMTLVASPGLFWPVN